MKTAIAHRPAGDRRALMMAAIGSPSPSQGRGGRGVRAILRPGAVEGPRGRQVERESARRRDERSPSVWSLRWCVARELSRQELRDAVYGWSLYLAAAVAVLVGTLLTYNVLRAVAASGLEVVARPFYSPLLVATSLAALYLAGWATLAIARPRDHGALRVLFFAPVDPLGLLGAHLLAAFAMYCLLMLLTVPLFALLAALTNLPLSAPLVLGIVVSPALVAPAVTIGLFISAIAPSARGAAFLLAATLALLLAVQLGASALLRLPPTSRYYDALLFLRELVRSVREALQWVSPLALLSDSLDAAFRASWRELLVRALSGLAGGAVWLALAAWALRRRGVLP